MTKTYKVYSKKYGNDKFMVVPRDLNVTYHKDEVSCQLCELYLQSQGYVKEGETELWQPAIIESENGDDLHC